ncbi:hypothetical protein [Streptomyces fuscigenes]|uniref:hypothetical protein n=1 Tax=Streptomyces fuscigenes TaxID=1528880 RepID=UPI001F185EDF|nr:hypothetical protein [Streptomyces fuscigenes]MCF3964801.1 hypothetical protein [Streptomyces fuscigenes]
MPCVVLHPGVCRGIGGFGDVVPGLRQEWAVVLVLVLVLAVLAVLVLWFCRRC